MIVAVIMSIIRIALIRSNGNSLILIEMGMEIEMELSECLRLSHVPGLIIT